MATESLTDGPYWQAYVHATCQTRDIMSAAVSVLLVKPWLHQHEKEFTAGMHRCEAGCAHQRLLGSKLPMCAAGRMFMTSSGQAKDR